MNKLFNWHAGNVYSWNRDVVVSDGVGYVGDDEEPTSPAQGTSRSETSSRRKGEVHRKGHPRIEVPKNGDQRDVKVAPAWAAAVPEAVSGGDEDRGI